MVTVSYWLWWAAGVLAVLTVMFTLTRLDAVRAELGRVARDSDPSATADMVERVVHLSVLVIVCSGLVLGILGGVVALRLRAGRGWARAALATITVLAVAYGVFVLSATGPLVLAYTAVALAAGVCMYLPGAKRWFI